MDLTLNFITILLGAVYSVITLKVGCKIAEIPSNTYAKYIMYTTASIGIYSVVYMVMHLPHYNFYLVAFLIITAQLRWLGAKQESAVFLASYVVVNMATIFIGLLGVFSYVYGISPKAVMDDATMRLYMTIAMYAALLFVGTKTMKSITLKGLQAIIHHKKYANLVSGLALILVLPAGFDEYIVMTEASYDQQMYILFMTVIFNMMLYYTVLYHTVRTIDIEGYRQKTDETKNYYKQLQQHRTEITKKSTKDELTNLYNKMYMTNYIREALDEVLNTKVAHGIIFIDINGLKFVNDNYGHDAGDRLIKRVSNAVKSSIRDSRQDRAGRVGGDEILVFVSCTTQKDLLTIIDRIRLSIEQENDMEIQFLISASIGGLLINKDVAVLGLEDILHQVDILMRRDKEKFYNQIDNQGF